MTLRRIVSSFAGDTRGLAKYLLLAARPGASWESPIFVVGPPRSGTTMLYTRLISYNCFCGPSHETGFFRITNPYLVPMDPIPKADWERFVDEAKTQAELLDMAIKWFKENFGAAYFLEKTPQHCLHYRRIFTAWAGSKIIGIVRHPLDCVASAVRNKEFIPQGSNIESAAYYWNKCAAAVDQLRAHERSKVVRYEDIVAGKIDILSVARFIAGDDVCTSTHKEVHHSFIGKKGFELLGGPIESNRIGAWKEVLSSNQACRTWKITESTAARFGYNIDTY